MKNVILVEDRIFRQKNHLGDKTVELEKFSFLENISGGVAFTELKQHVLEKKYSVFDNYSTILLHRSAFETEVRNGLINYLKDRNNNKLVFFSGGITGAQLSKLKNLEFMLMNVTEFYSNNLFVFLEHDAENLLQLAFGDMWETSILIDAIEKLTIYEKKFTIDTPFSRIEDNLGLNNVIIEKYFSDIKSPSSKISKSELGSVLKKMNDNLKSIL
jgi:hypothetical protein